MLIVTSRATYQVKRGMLGVKTRWVMWHEELDRVDAVRAVGPQDYVITGVVLEGAGRTYEFNTGFHSPVYSEETKREIALGNAQVIANDIRVAADEARSSSVAESTDVPSATAQGAANPGPSSSPFSFDPAGPEKAAQAAEQAYGNREWAKSFALFVKGVDKLHDFYVFEEFRNRQPSPGDAWMVQGVSKSLGITLELEPNVDVTEQVREVTHRLSTICTAVEGAGGNPILYARVLREVERLAG